MKIKKINRGVSGDTDPNLVPAPGVSGVIRTVLQSKLVEQLLHKKLPSNKPFRIDDTNVAVSVTDRFERDLVKRFDELDID